MSDKQNWRKDTLEGQIASVLQSNKIWIAVGIVLLTVPGLFFLLGSDARDDIQKQQYDNRRTLKRVDESVELQTIEVQQDNRSQICTLTVNDSIREIKQIFDEAGTDKSRNHGYYRTYGRIFHPYKNDPVRLLEIGVYTGKSMEAWERYFPNHDYIYGIGYGKGFAKQEKKKVVEGKKITLFNGDQSDAEFLKYVCYDMGEPLDIVIDDGSHVPDHQQISLENLLDCLKPGGLYIIEDMFTSYYNMPGAEVYGYKLNQTGLWQPGSFVERVKKLVDVINREEHLHQNMTFFKNDHQIASINFEQGLIVFRKTDSWDVPFQNRIPNFVLRGAQP